MDDCKSLCIFQYLEAENLKGSLSVQIQQLFLKKKDDKYSYKVKTYTLKPFRYVNCTDL